MANDSHDEQLAGILAGLIGPARAGAAPDIDAAVRENPDVAAELRELWTVAALADEFASGDGPQAVDPTLDPRPTSAAATAFAISVELGDYELLEKIGE